jgi:alkylhydroperoxidase family enzyme
MSRVSPVDLQGNAVQTSLLARVLGRRPEILQAFGRLDAAARFHGLLAPSLKEAVRRATAGEVGCAYCQSLGTHQPDPDDRRESLAVAYALLIAEDPTAISDAQFDVLRSEFNEDEIVELTAFICFVAIGGQLFGAALALEPASPQEARAYQQVVGRP